MTAPSQAIILSAGRARRLWPLTLAWPKALLAVGGKPVAFHWLSALVECGISTVHIVANPSSHQLLEDVVCRSFDGAPIDVHVVDQTLPYGPGHAFATCEPLVDGPTLLVLADTLCAAPTDLCGDWIGVAPYAPGTHDKWCVVDVDDDGFVRSLIDKPLAAPASPLAAVGVYHFSDADVLRECLRGAACSEPGPTGEIELSSILRAYGACRPIRPHLIEDWTDLGTLAAYGAAVRDRLPARSFTRMQVSRTGAVAKGTDDAGGVGDERAWFDEIPASARLLAPRVLDGEVGGASYTTELLDYPTLSELFVTGAVAEHEWGYVLGEVIGQVRGALWSEPVVHLDLEARAGRMYRDKPLERLARWDRADVLERDALQVNDKVLPGFSALWQLVSPRLDEVIASSAEHAAYIHGDLSFANILFSPRYGLVRLVDPRGNFGGPGAIGDARYDGAKLRQCYHGRYDVLVAGLFDLEERDSGVFEFSLYPSHLPDPAALDDTVAALMPWSIEHLALIEATLFLSMIPLHTESPRRQLACFLTALGCLDRCAAHEEVTA